MKINKLILYITFFILTIFIGTSQVFAVSCGRVDTAGGDYYYQCGGVTFTEVAKTYFGDSITNFINTSTYVSWVFFDGQSGVSTSWTRTFPGCPTGSCMEVIGGGYSCYDHDYGSGCSGCPCGSGADNDSSTGNTDCRDGVGMCDYKWNAGDDSCADGDDKKDWDVYVRNTSTIFEFPGCYSITSQSSPTLSFSADATIVALGKSTILRWSSQYTTSCTASGDWSGDKALVGEEETLLLFEPEINYNLSCIGLDGTTVSASVFVAVGEPDCPPGQTWHPNIRTVLDPTYGQDIIECLYYPSDPLEGTLYYEDCDCDDDSDPETPDVLCYQACEAYSEDTSYYYGTNLYTNERYNGCSCSPGDCSTYYIQDYVDDSYWEDNGSCVEEIIMLDLYSDGDFCDGAYNSLYWEIRDANYDNLPADELDNCRIEDEDKNTIVSVTQSSGQVGVGTFGNHTYTLACDNTTNTSSATFPSLKFPDEPVQNLRIDNVACDSIGLSWYNVGCSKYYNLYRSDIPGLLASTSYNGYQDNSVQESTFYRYAIEACNSNRDCQSPSIISTTTPACSTPPPSSESYNATCYTVPDKLYVNKPLIWEMGTTTTGIKVPSNADTDWSGNGIFGTKSTNDSSVLNHLYTTVGTKYINATSTWTGTNGTGYTATCSASTSVILGGDIIKEI